MAPATSARSHSPHRPRRGQLLCRPSDGRQVWRANCPGSQRTDRGGRAEKQTVPRHRRRAADSERPRASQFGRSRRLWPTQSPGNTRAPYLFEIRMSSNSALRFVQDQSQRIQHVDQLAQTAVVAPVEFKDDPRQLEDRLAVFLFRQRIDDFDLPAAHDVGEVFVQCFHG